MSDITAKQYKQDYTGSMSSAEQSPSDLVLDLEQADRAISAAWASLSPLQRTELASFVADIHPDDRKGELAELNYQLLNSDYAQPALGEALKRSNDHGRQ